jgi:hypothetical protein
MMNSYFTLGKSYRKLNNLKKAEYFYHLAYVKSEETNGSEDLRTEKFRDKYNKIKAKLDFMNHFENVVELDFDQFQKEAADQ